MRNFSRNRIVLVTVCLLAVLDLGRSIFARVGYAEPAESWQTAPYEALAWPPGTTNQAIESQGKKVYTKHCAICHGVNGRGDGPAAPSLIPRPRDFTVGEFKYKTTLPGEDASDADLRHSIENGLVASAMPYWKDILSSEDIGHVIAYIREFSLFGPPESSPVSIQVIKPVEADEASLARGRSLFEKSCAECHESDGRGDIRPSERMDDYPVPTRDLTAPWTYRGGSDVTDIWTRLSSGMRPGPMPDFVDTLTDRDRWDIANYVRSLHRLAPWEPGGVLIGPGYHEDLIKRGDYIVHTEMCGLCHTQVNRDLIYSGDDYYLAGGMGIPIYPHGVYVSRNLTPDIETGIGSWSVEEVANAIRNGRTPDRLLFFFGMPWMYLHNLSQEDALAVASFLKSREPVTNRIPMPLRYGFVETVVAKISYSSGFPPMGNPTKLTYKAGNYGETEPEGPVREWPQTFLIHSQLGILVLAVLAYFILGRPSGSQIGRTRGLLITASSWSCIALVSFLCWVMYQTPVLAIIPPAEISKGASGGIPAVDESKLANVEMINMAHRGRYLYTVTSCAFCHGNDGSGGLKISMQSFGSLWVRNITPHEATGIGSWQDEEIARAIRSGVSKSGNALHWQGMIWDHLSNLDEEDVRSLIVYLRNMPAIENSVPEPTAPSPDDCVEYTFFLVEDDRPGCDG